MLSASCVAGIEGQRGKVPETRVYSEELALKMFRI